MANYNEITCKSACNKIKRSMPYKWDLNIYRGCEHQCKYCYALYSHKYLTKNNKNNNSKNNKDIDKNSKTNYIHNPSPNTKFFKNIYIKTNIVEELEKQLLRSSWNNEIINIGGVTDSYQPIEADYGLMSEILQLLIKYKNPAIISTKSDLILRDLDLINELSEITYINVATSVTTMDEKLRSILEPVASPSKNRIKILKKFRKRTNASTGLHLMPIIPHITDSDKNLNLLFKNGRLANVHYKFYQVFLIYMVKPVHFSLISLKEILRIYIKT